MAVQNNWDSSVYHHAIFNAPPEEVAKLMLGMPDIQNTEVEFPIGMKLSTPQGAVIIRHSEKEYRIYGYSSEIVKFGKHRIPVDLRDTLLFIIENKINTRVH